MGKNYPCDGADGFCPYEESDNAESMWFCYNHCGLGSDEDYSPYSPDWEEEEERHFYEELEKENIREHELYEEIKRDYEDYEDDVSEIGYNPYIGGYDDDC